MAIIQLTEHAEEDIDRIELFTIMNTGDLRYADQTVDTITATIHTLSSDPMRCSLVHDETLALLGFRWIEAGNYYVFYIYDEYTETLYVDRVLHKKSNWIGTLKGEPYVD